MTVRLGVDIGGTGIKAAPVDLEQGALVGDRQAVSTPHPATPAAVALIVAELVDGVATDGPVGLGFPGVVKHGVTATAANLHPDWVGTNAEMLFAHHLGGRQVAVINDADAAGLAEMGFGAGAGESGVAVMVTLGTGIGTAVFVDGTLVPNTEYGHLVVSGSEAEQFASARAKEHDDQSWKHWATHVLGFLKELERLIWPDLFIIGGGISVEFRRFCERLQTSAPVVAATLGNDAGIVGAAMALRQPAVWRPAERLDEGVNS
ncbi:MAG: ROK family protein [Acidimicrobiia bacterium]